ncbi:MAG: P-loop NTPase [Anaerolineales bacterium]|nr:P-loop NTPase [Anaerolineales bacterium]
MRNRHTDCHEPEGFSPTARDHAQRPRHQEALETYHARARVTGPCGDTMEFRLKAKDDAVADISFSTDGCGASKACGSMAACLADGRSVADAARISPREILAALGGVPPESEHCALLAVTTLKAACEEYLSRPAVPRESNGQAGTNARTDPHSGGAAQLDGESDKHFADRRALHARLSGIRHKVIVLSGKGGVGKSTLAVNIAVALVRAGKRVGLLDADLHGPSVPTMLGIEGETIRGGSNGMIPVERGGLKVMSIGFLLENPDDAVIWRGPAKMGAIRQFLSEVAWGELDYLVIDSPPGTGDEPLSVVQLLGALDGAVIVTTPQKVAAVDVRKSITFCRKLGIPVIGVVENMSGFICPKCGEVTQILRSGGGRRIAEDMAVSFLGSIPIDPAIAEASDNGRAFFDQPCGSPAAKILQEVIRPVLALAKAAGARERADITTSKEKPPMRIAIPLADGKLALHFGHCESFALIDADVEHKKILAREDVGAPPHEPGLLPSWLAERGAQVIIAGGMGSRAQNLFRQQGIRVVIGAPAGTAETVAQDFLNGSLQTGDNICDH